MDGAIAPGINVRPARHAGQPPLALACLGAPGQPHTMQARASSNIHQVA